MKDFLSALPGSILITVVAALVVLCPFAAVSAQSQTSDAELTRITVRAVSHDAKIIGSGVGGARIVIQDARSGAVLAEGLQEGGTGDTERIMRPAAGRSGPVYDTEGAARFTAEVLIYEPTIVDITAYGPLETTSFIPQSSKRMLLIPGQHVEDEGIILELNGLTVEIIDWEQRLDGTFAVRSRVTMLCGCPTEPDGLWNADEIEVAARLLDDGELVSETRLEYAGETSTYAGKLEPRDEGPDSRRPQRLENAQYVLEVTAADPHEGNFGFVRQTIAIP